MWDRPGITFWSARGGLILFLKINDDSQLWSQKLLMTLKSFRVIFAFMNWTFIRFEAQSSNLTEKIVYVMYWRSGETSATLNYLSD
jgi:hypothetical protein